MIKIVDEAGLRVRCNDSARATVRATVHWTFSFSPEGAGTLLRAESFGASEILGDFWVVWRRKGGWCLTILWNANGRQRNCSFHYQPETEQVVRVGLLPSTWEGVEVQYTFDGRLLEDRREVNLVFPRTRTQPQEIGVEQPWPPPVN